MRYTCSLKYRLSEELVELSFASVFEKAIPFSLFFFIIYLSISEVKNETVYPQFSVACSKPLRTRRKLSWKRYLRSNHNIKSHIITLLDTLWNMFLYLKIQTLKLSILTKSLFIVEGIWHTLLQIIYSISGWFSLQYAPGLTWITDSWLVGPCLLLLQNHRS